MSAQGLSKSALQQSKARLETYQKALPSLELKRRKLQAAKSAADKELLQLESAFADLLGVVPRELPMLANRSIDLDELVVVRRADVGRQNVAGVWLPTVESVDIEVKSYSMLVRPHWVDRVAELLAECADLKVRLEVARRRAEILGKARVKITQRVNLFDKVLIPRTQAMIRRIQVHLGDAERAAVVRAKVAQRKSRRASA